MTLFPVSYKAGGLGICSRVLTLQQSYMDEDFGPPEAGREGNETASEDVGG